jgi:hypothetical protein
MGCHSTKRPGFICLGTLSEDFQTPFVLREVASFDSPFGMQRSLFSLSCSFSIALFLSLFHHAVMKLNEETLRSDPTVERLLKNPNWRPAAEAAIAYLLRSVDCPIASWRKSSTWAQVQMIYDRLSKCGK